MILFEDRLDAGEKLAQKLMPLAHELKDALVIGIPRGGIPVGYGIAGALDAPLDFIVLRKLPIPDNPEAGFGAVTLDKTTIFNRGILSRLDLGESEVSAIVDEVYDEVIRRDRVFRGGRPIPDLKNRSVILTDDGLASGYTMLAAVHYARKKKVQRVIAAIPVAHENAYSLIERNVDDAIAYHISRASVFAVASFYRRFPDLSDEEVIDLLDKRKKEMTRKKRRQG